MKSKFCEVKKILLAQEAAIKMFGPHVVDCCPPLGFGKKLGWVAVSDLLRAIAKETPDQPLDPEITEHVLDLRPPSDLEDCANRNYQAAYILALYEDSLEMLVSHPALDRVGSKRVEQLFSLSHTYVQSTEIKQLALPEHRPAVWSVNALRKALYSSSKQTAERRAKQIAYRQTTLDKKRTRLLKVATAHAEN